LLENQKKKVGYWKNNMRIFKFRGWTGDKFILHNLLSEIGGNPDCNCFSGDLIFQQFTGLKDKNGIEIYEGDILKWPEGWVYFETLGEVKWLTNGYYFENKHVIMLLPEVIYAEVVGNIFENPELVG
jgi:hypothetical protein